MKPLIVVTLCTALSYGSIQRQVSGDLLPQPVQSNVEIGKSTNLPRSSLSIDDICTVVICTKEDVQEKTKVQDTIPIRNSNGIYYSPENKKLYASNKGKLIPLSVVYVEIKLKEELTKKHPSYGFSCLYEDSLQGQQVDLCFNNKNYLFQRDPFKTGATISMALNPVNDENITFSIEDAIKTSKNTTILLK